MTHWLILTAAGLTGLFGLALTIWGCWYLATGAMSWRRPMDYGWHPAHTRFAVLIAARNEELVIGPLINSLLTQDYPPELYDIWVLPNNCTDNTALAARQFGAQVLECTVPVKSKGEVLRFAYQCLKGRGYDAYCVFDADNVVAPGFLKEMNNAYMAGARAAQGYRDSKNPYDTALSGCCSIYYWMMDRFYNTGKAGMGLSALINGTGFMVSSDLLDKLGGWNSRTISEDLELTAQCVLAGQRVHWVPKAVTYDEQPLSWSQSIAQRRRWTSGTLQVAECYLGRTGRALRSRPGLSLVDLVSTLAIPFYQVAALAGAVLSGAAAALSCPEAEQAGAAFLAAVALNLVMAAMTSTLAALLVVSVEGKRDKRLWKALALYWLFLLSWGPITIGSLAKKTTVWEEIRHTRNVMPTALARESGL